MKRLCSQRHALNVVADSRVSRVQHYLDLQNGNRARLVRHDRHDASPRNLAQQKTFRMCKDNVCTTQEATTLVDSMRRLSCIEHLFASPGERKLFLPYAEDDLSRILSEGGGNDFGGPICMASSMELVSLLCLLQDLRSRVSTALIQSLSESGKPPFPLREAGCIFSWLSPIKSCSDRIMLSPSELNKDLYTSVHCDKRNNFEYDYTALLYLNSDFRGGNLVFFDPGHVESSDELTSTIIEPTLGRLVMFDAGPTNIHRVEEVLQGNRFLLSLWFQRVLPPYL